MTERMPLTAEGSDMVMMPRGQRSNAGTQLMTTPRGQRSNAGTRLMTTPRGQRSNAGTWMTTPRGLSNVGTCLLASLLVGSLLPSARAQTTDETPTSDAPVDDGTDLPERSRRARALFERARDAYESGRFPQALDLFQRAYELAPRAELLFNVAQTHDRLSQRVEAIAAYQAFLEARPDASNRGFAEARIEILQEEQAQQEREAERDDAVVAAAADPHAALVAPPDSGASGARTGGFALLGVAGAAAVAAVATGVLSLGRRADLEDDCPELRCSPDQQGDLDALRRTTRATDALIGVAGVAAAVGVVLVLVGKRGDEAPATALRVGPTSVTLTQRF